MSILSPNVLIPLIFIIIGAALLFPYFRSLAKMRASQDWSTVQGTVVESWVGRSASTDDEGNVSYSYCPEIRYQYQVMGNEYQGDKISFSPKMSSIRSWAEKAIAKYPTGATVMIYYQPDNPSNAVLERSVSKVMLVLGILFVFIGILIYFLWG